jgi:ubiquinone/menaquinone biosynthesis C-methylase UbiE
MSFRDALADRTAAVYADFLVPHLDARACLLDCGCGAGTIAVGLADRAGVVVGLDLERAAFHPAIAHCAANSIHNVRFAAGDGARLPFASEAFDAVFMHSVLEAAADPAALVREAFRVLVPGGVMAAASVEHGGRVLAGPHRDVLERFYAVREELWELDRIARPRAGRELRRLLHDSGFTRTEATAHYLSYGTPNAVRSFGEARARDCAEPWLRARSIAQGLLTEDDLETTRRAWMEWSRSPASFFAFAWCRVVGWRDDA